MKRITKLVEAHLVNGVMALTPNPKDSFSARMVRARKGYLIGLKESVNKPADLRQPVAFRFAMFAAANQDSVEYNKAIKGVNLTRFTRDNLLITNV